MLRPLKAFKSWRSIWLTTETIMPLTHKEKCRRSFLTNWLRVVKSSRWEWFRGAGEHVIRAHCSFAVILSSNLYCMCFWERSKEGSVWIVAIMSVLLYIFYMFCNLLWINDKGKRGSYMTLWRGCAKQTIPLSVLVRNQTKGLDSRSRTRRK